MKIKYRLKDQKFSVKLQEMAYPVFDPKQPKFQTYKSVYFYLNGVDVNDIIWTGRSWDKVERDLYLCAFENDIKRVMRITSNPKWDMWGRSGKRLNNVELDIWRNLIIKDTNIKAWDHYFKPVPPRCKNGIKAIDDNLNPICKKEGIRICENCGENKTYKYLAFCKKCLKEDKRQL